MYSDGFRVDMYKYIRAFKGGLYELKSKLQVSPLQ